MEAHDTKILEGITVLDFTQALSGALTAWNFADLGARVWKVEKYGTGDQTRFWDPFINDVGIMFSYFNRNKQSVEINLSKPEGKDIIYELVKHVDLVLENFKSGTMDKLGFGYDVLSKINPRLTFVSLSGFGASGPLKKEPCFDIIAAAKSGFATGNGDPDGPPVKSGSCLMDPLSGIYAFNAALMGLIKAKKKGVGCHIDLAMMDIAMQTGEEYIMDYTIKGSKQSRYGNYDKIYSPSGIFEARDGFAVIIVNSEKRFHSLCKAFSLEHLLTDHRYSTNQLRLKNKEELVKEISAVTKTMYRKDIENLLTDVDVPASSVLSFIEAYTSEHANATRLTRMINQKGIGYLRIYNSPIRINDALIDIDNGAPMLGEHTKTILSEVGYSQEQIDFFSAAGVI